jgi:branched-chain amino acid aminotransferase
MEKKDLDWGSLTFAYTPTDYSYVCNYKDGAWGEDILTPDHTLQLSECAGIFHYCQEVFEGLKAYTTKDGDIVCFRPDMNASRMADSAKRICMPPFPEDRFVEAVKQVVEANLAWVPPFGSGATLYIRPFMIATGNVIGVKPATEYQFRILVTPVGPYYKGGVQPVALKVPEYDRAAPHGTGNIKAGLNYAMSLYPSVEAHAEGFADNMYLDPATRSFVEESGGANFLFVDAEGTIVVPQSATDSILPSITRRSLVTVARDLLGMKVVERPVRFDEIAQFNECGMCGTAAVISPVGKVVDTDGSEIVFGAGMEHVGPVLAKLRETLTAIQAGELEGPEGWVVEIC